MDHYKELQRANVEIKIVKSESKHQSSVSDDGVMIKKPNYDTLGGIDCLFLCSSDKQLCRCKPKTDLREWLTMNIPQ